MIVFLKQHHSFFLKFFLFNASYTTLLLLLLLLFSCPSITFESPLSLCPCPSSFPLNSGSLFSLSSSFLSFPLTTVLMFPSPLPLSSGLPSSPLTLEDWPPGLCQAGVSTPGQADLIVGLGAGGLRNMTLAPIPMMLLPPSILAHPPGFPVTPEERRKIDT